MEAPCMQTDTCSMGVKASPLAGVHTEATSFRHLAVCTSVPWGRINDCCFTTVLF